MSYGTRVGTLGKFQQAIIDVVSSSSENIFAPYIVDGFESGFMLVKPQNLGALWNIGPVDGFGNWLH